MTAPPAHFSAAERDTLYRVLHARRDMRHFLPDTSIDEQVIQRLLRAALVEEDSWRGAAETAR